MTHLTLLTAKVQIAHPVDTSMFLILFTLYKNFVAIIEYIWKISADVGW